MKKRQFTTKISSRLTLNMIPPANLSRGPDLLNFLVILKVSSLYPFSSFEEKKKKATSKKAHLTAQKQKTMISHFLSSPFCMSNAVCASFPWHPSLYAAHFHKHHTVADCWHAAHRWRVRNSTCWYIAKVSLGVGKSNFLNSQHMTLNAHGLSF